MESIIGLFMFYLWVHGTIIIFKRVANTTSYENGVLVGALVAFIMFVIGSLS